MWNLVLYQISIQPFRKKKQDIPKMFPRCSQNVPKMFPRWFPRWFPKSDANIVRCFTSTKCKKMLNVKLKSEKRLILTNKCPSNQMSFEGLTIVFYVLPN
jgi:hypothetical protein